MFGLVLDLEGPSFERLLQLSTTDVGGSGIAGPPSPHWNCWDFQKMSSCLWLNIVRVGNGFNYDHPSRCSHKQTVWSRGGVFTIKSITRLRLKDHQSSGDEAVLPQQSIMNHSDLVLFDRKQLFLTQIWIRCPLPLDCLLGIQHRIDPLNPFSWDQILAACWQTHCRRVTLLYEVICWQIVGKALFDATEVLPDMEHVWKFQQ